MMQIVFSTVLREINDQAFRGWTALADAVLPLGMESIGRYAFTGAMFKDVRLPATLKWIGEGAFENNARLTSVDLPDNVIDLNANVFRGCSSLSCVKLAERTEKIGSQAFCRCLELISILIPESFRQIGEGKFNGTGDKFTIMSHRYSYAEEYARQHHITYQLLF